MASVLVHSNQETFAFIPNDYALICSKVALFLAEIAEFKDVNVHLMFMWVAGTIDSAFLLTL